MSAECEKHGVDLNIDTEGNLFCQVCDAEKVIARLKAEVERLRVALADQIAPAGCQCGNNGGGDCEWCLVYRDEG
jgi:predicted flavoprotein YhiN